MKRLDVGSKEYGVGSKGRWLTFYISLLFLTATFFIVSCGTPSQVASPTFAPTPTDTVVAPTTTSPAETSAEFASPTPEPEIVSTSPGPTEETPKTTEPTATEEIEPAPKSIFFGLTYQQPDGNRFVSGRGHLLNASPIDIVLAGEPRWVVSAPQANGQTIWAVALADGRTQAFQIDSDGAVNEISIAPAQLPPGMPPLLRVENGSPLLPVAPTDAASLQTHPIFLPTTNQMVSLQADGNLLIWNDAQTDFTFLEVNALPDARILVDEASRLLFLSDATTRYAHGVLGDNFEAASITLVETQPEPRVAFTIPIPDPTVVEGISPIWADLNGDSRREIIVTLSNSDMGAQIVVFDDSGQQVAAGPSIGRGNRWRHQLVVAPFGPKGELELVDVLTPHIGGTVEFYQLQGHALEIVARVPDYTSHVIGTRNLDMAVAADFDGDDRIELLLPNQARTELGAIARTSDSAEVVWSLPVEGQVVTNLAAVALPDGQLAVGVGRSDGVLRVWGH